MLGSLVPDPLHPLRWWPVPVRGSLPRQLRQLQEHSAFPWLLALWPAVSRVQPPVRYTRPLESRHRRSLHLLMTTPMMTGESLVSPCGCQRYSRTPYHVVFGSYQETPKLFTVPGTETVRHIMEPKTFSLYYSVQPLLHCNLGCYARQPDSMVMWVLIYEFLDVMPSRVWLGSICWVDPTRIALLARSMGVGRSNDRWVNCCRGVSG